MTRRLREARDLILWPLLTTIAALLGQRTAAYVRRTNPEHEPEPIS